MPRDTRGMDKSNPIFSVFLKNESEEGKKGIHIKEHNNFSNTQETSELSNVNPNQAKVYFTAGYFFCKPSQNSFVPRQLPYFVCKT